VNADVLVIGAGAGGLCAAARLAQRGQSPLVVESRDRVGGRASSLHRDGYTINTGAIAIEYGGVLEETFRAVSAPFEIRIPDPATKFRIKGREIQLSKGPLGKLVNGALKRGAALLRSDDERTTVREWLDGYTRNDTAHAIFRNLCAAIFAVNADELPVKAFMTYFLTKGAVRDFGFSPTGTLGLMQGLADTIARDGGEVRLNTSIDALEVDVFLVLLGMCVL
jgi:phytoene dehydrogenase-like protein